MANTTLKPTICPPPKFVFLAQSILLSQIHRSNYLSDVFLRKRAQAFQIEHTQSCFPTLTLPPPVSPQFSKHHHHPVRSSQQKRGASALPHLLPHLPYPINQQLLGTSLQKDLSFPLPTPYCAPVLCNTFLTGNQSLLYPCSPSILHMTARIILPKHKMVFNHSPT